MFDYSLAKFASGRAWNLLGLLAVLWLLTLSGIESVPIETHEAYVLSTAQQMKTSGDLMIPRYNNELRLNKPPLNYWATLLVSAIDPVSDEIQIWHGRAVSLAAVLLMVLLTARTGAILYGRETGLLAAILLLGAKGLFDLSHNAKPDMLFACLCALQLFAWIDAWKAPSAGRQRMSAWLGWFAGAMATLTKGPQVPGVFLVGFVIFLLSQAQDRRRVFEILRPFSGAVVFVVLALPWWIVLHHRLHALGVDLSGSQLSGSLLHNLASWKELLSFYYLWVPVVQLLPASLLLLVALPTALKNKAAMQPSTRLLIYVSVAMIALFTLGGHYRKHYLLPLYPVFSILLANSVRLVRFPGDNEKGRKYLWAAGCVAAAGCAGCLAWMGRYVMIALFGAAGLLAGLLLKREFSRSLRATPLFSKQLLIAAVACAVLGAAFNAYNPSLRWPIAQQAFKKSICKKLSESDRLVCWKTSENVLPFFARRPVLAFKDPELLSRYLATNRNSHAVFAITPSKELPGLNQFFLTRLVCSAENKREPKESLSVAEVLDVRAGSAIPDTK